MIKKINIVFMIALLAGFTSCKKFLDEKSDRSLIVPKSAADLQALLENANLMNSRYAAAGETSSDDYYLTDADYEALPSIFNRRMYTWEKDGLFDTGYNGNDWNNCYKAIYVANAVLELAKDMPNTAELANIRGQALVFRASRYFDALSIWAMPFDETTQDSDPGIPLRLDPDFNKQSVRASVRECYQQIINDLKAAIRLLPAMQVASSRPSKAFAYGLLARCYQSRREHVLAGLYADSCLQMQSALLDFNMIRATAANPIPALNDETIFYSLMNNPDILAVSRAKIDPGLYDLYETSDLRKTIFFRVNTDGTYGFKGNYTGSSTRFSGMATDEVILIRAESYARSGEVEKSLQDLNRLLEKRYVTGTFVPYAGKTVDQALALILTERRKELLMRGLRWVDIRRLNKESANIVLQRTVAGSAYVLRPNNMRYALPLPDDVVALSGMPQNPR